jgi:hypothetical protein
MIHIRLDGQKFDAGDARKPAPLMGVFCKLLIYKETKVDSFFIKV